jgi:hypothetical protein
MKKIIFTFIFTVAGLLASAQNGLVTSPEDFIKTNLSTKELVRQLIDSAKNKVEVLACDTTRSKDIWYQIYITRNSPMGVVASTTGGLLIDDGWIRILGSGSTRLNRSLPDWNKGKSFNEFGDTTSFLLIADDVIGGFFAINGGFFGKEKGKIYYLSPDNLQWEDLGITYTDFLFFCFNGDLDKFYQGLRWNNWRQEVSKLGGDKVYSFYPFLWSKEGKDINKDTRKIIPIEEQYFFNITSRIQLGLDKNEH